jgi:hypothetical protein
MVKEEGNRRGNELLEMMSDPFRMFKKAVFAPAHPRRAKTRPFPKRGRSKRKFEACFSCTLRF